MGDDKTNASEIPGIIAALSLLSFVLSGLSSFFLWALVEAFDLFSEDILIWPYMITFGLFCIFCISGIIASVIKN